MVDKTINMSVGDVLTFDISEEEIGDDSIGVNKSSEKYTEEYISDLKWVFEPNGSGRYEIEYNGKIIEINVSEDKFNIGLDLRDKAVRNDQEQIQVRLFNRSSSKITGDLKLFFDSNNIDTKNVSVSGRNNRIFSFTLDTTNKSLGTHDITAKIDGISDTREIEIVKGELVVTCSRIDSDTNTRSELTKIETTYEIPDLDQRLYQKYSVGIRTGTESSSDNTKTEFRVYEIDDSFWYFGSDSDITNYTNSSYITDLDYSYNNESSYEYITREHANKVSEQYSINTSDAGAGVSGDKDIVFSFEDQTDSQASVSGIGWIDNDNKENDLTKHRCYLRIRSDSLASGESDITVGTSEDVKVKKIGSGVYSDIVNSNDKIEFKLRYK